MSGPTLFAARLNARLDKIVTVDKESRRKLLGLVRDLRAGRLSNDSFESAEIDSLDPAIEAVRNELTWQLDSLSEAVYDPNPVMESILTRVELFLDSDCEYQPPAQDDANRLLQLRATIGSSLGIGSYTLDQFGRPVHRSLQPSWPFSSLEDLMSRVDFK